MGEVETYWTAMCWLYLILFLIGIIFEIAELVYRIRKRCWRFWWVTPLGTGWAFCGLIGLMSAAGARDDPSSPGYDIYRGWGLREFALRDLRTLGVWILLGLAVYLACEKGRGMWTRGCAAAGCLTVVIGWVMLLVFSCVRF